MKNALGFALAIAAIFTLPANADAYRVLRKPDGSPDLQGV
jgi:hypothetical protein